MNCLFDGVKARALIPSFEVIGEFTNLFNIVNVSSINQTVPVSPTNVAPILTGTNILTTSSARLIATGGFPQRIFQFGFKFHF
ncbi:MAG TPA: hypothetical protein VI260_31260 [Blastocatellia bacterium]